MPSNKVTIQLTEKLASGVCKEIDVSWSDVCDMAVNPIRLPNGMESRLWSFYILNGQKGSYGLCVGKKENVHSVIAMQIDYDDGAVTIDDFCKSFDCYAFLLYTSKSHTSDHHRFRVIIPLERPVLGELYSSKGARDHLRTIFIGCDPSTFDGWRKQRIPHTCAATKQYEYRVNKGKLYSLDVEKLTTFYIAEKEMYSSGFGGTVTLKIDPFKSTLEEIYLANNLKNLTTHYAKGLCSLNWFLRSSGQNVHDHSRTAIYALRKNGMSSSDVYAWIMMYAPQKFQKEMRDLCYGNI